MTATDDRVRQWQEAVARVELAGAELHSTVEFCVDLLRIGRKQQANGRPLADVVPDLIALGGVEARRSVAAAVEGWERAFTHYRVVAVRVMVDAGLTVTDVASLLDVSRQMVSKLYHQADEEGP